MVGNCILPTYIIGNFYRIDLKVPEFDAIGGFSICSPPYKALKDRIIQIAVKYVPYTPAEWCHTVGVDVSI